MASQHARYVKAHSKIDDTTFQLIDQYNLDPAIWSLEQRYRHGVMARIPVLLSGFPVVGDVADRRKSGSLSSVGGELAVWAFP